MINALLLATYAYGLYLIGANTPWKTGVLIYLCILAGIVVYARLRSERAG